MRVQVIYFDNSLGFVNAESLEDLIKKRRIIAFRRSDGWARVGRDPVRQERRPYKGPERRRN
jgi:hypothetical protein